MGPALGRLGWEQFWTSRCQAEPGAPPATVGRARAGIRVSGALQYSCSTWGQPRLRAHAWGPEPGGIPSGALAAVGQGWAWAGLSRGFRTPAGLGCSVWHTHAEDAPAVGGVSSGSIVVILEPSAELGEFQSQTFGVACPYWGSPHICLSRASLSCSRCFGTPSVALRAFSLLSVLVDGPACLETAAPFRPRAVGTFAWWPVGVGWLASP